MRFLLLIPRSWPRRDRGRRTNETAKRNAHYCVHVHISNAFSCVRALKRARPPTGPALSDRTVSTSHVTGVSIEDHADDRRDKIKSRRHGSLRAARPANERIALRFPPFPGPVWRRGNVQSRVVPCNRILENRAWRSGNLPFKSQTSATHTVCTVRARASTDLQTIIHYGVYTSSCTEHTHADVPRHNVRSAPRFRRVRRASSSCVPTTPAK